MPLRMSLNLNTRLLVADDLSAAESHLPVAERISRQVHYLPMYWSLDPQWVRLISRIIIETQELATLAMLTRAKSWAAGLVVTGENGYAGRAA